MVTSLMTLCMTLVILSPHVVHNSVPREEITCSNVSCDRVTSDNCPLWHFCNTRTGQCRPCGSCKDAVDNAAYQTAPLNCRDPTYCVTSYDFLPEHLCPRLKVKDGYQCSGNCVPCSSALGYSLGTVCRLSCADGDSEAFACYFLNEIAQWNITRRPLWLEIENRTSLLSGPSHSEDTIPFRSVHHGAIYAPSTSSPTGADAHTNSKFEFSTIILAIVSVVAVATVVGVAAAIFRKRTKSPQATHHTEDNGWNLPEEQQTMSIDPTLRTNTAPDNNNNNRSTEQTPRPIKEPIELSCHSVSMLEEECLIVHPQVPRNVPTENSDTHCSIQTSTSQTEKNRNSCCFDDELYSGCRISLRSDRGHPPQIQMSHPNHPLVNFSNTTHQDKADNRWYIHFNPLNRDEETSQKYVL